MRWTRAGALLCALTCGTLAQAGGKAHVHGSGQLDVAVEAGAITLRLETPLDSLLGFERAPRTDAERRLADAAVARLEAGDALFRIDPAGGCRLAKVTLASAALRLGPPGTAAAADGHADLTGSYEFTCADAAKAAFIDIGLFGFAQMQRVQVQVATPRGQFRRDLKRPAQRIVLTR